MNGRGEARGARDLVDDEFLLTYGDGYQQPVGSASPQTTHFRGDRFTEWHLPIRQELRRRQHVNGVDTILGARAATPLKYLTATNADLWDVRVIARHAAPAGAVVEYLGFGIPRQVRLPNALDEDDAVEKPETSESALFVEGLVTVNSRAVVDPFSDLGVPGSHARAELGTWEPFDIVSVDLAPSTVGDTLGDATTCGAIARVMTHQSSAEFPWVLLITVRAGDLSSMDPGLRNAARMLLANLSDADRDECYEAIGVTFDELVTELDAAWDISDAIGLALYSLGVVGWVTHLIAGSSPTDVRLASACRYLSIGGGVSLCFAFVLAAASQSATSSENESEGAANLARMSILSDDLDRIFAESPGRKQQALLDTEELIDTTGYDLAAFIKWVHGR